MILDLQAASAVEKKNNESLTPGFKVGCKSGAESPSPVFLSPRERDKHVFLSGFWSCARSPDSD